MCVEKKTQTLGKINSEHLKNLGVTDYFVLQNSLSLG